MTDFPLTDQFQAFELDQLRPEYVDETVSGVVHVTEIPAQRYQVRLQTVPLDLDLADRVMAFLRRMGQGRPYTLPLPLKHQTRGALVAETVRAAGSYAPGSTTLTIDGITPDLSGALIEGDLIQFAGHSKVYEVAADVDADGTGSASLAIYPGLAKPVNATEQLIYSGVKLTVRTRGKPKAFKVSRGAGKSPVIEIDANEVIG